MYDGQAPEIAPEAAPLSPIRVLVADDQPLMRAGFRMILDAEEDLQVVGEAGDGLHAARRHSVCSPTSC